MKKQLSGVAQCAQAIRVELKTKFPNITFRVTSKNYSGGDSVDVEWELGPTTKEVEALINKYQYGQFNGMDDMYEHTNRIEGLPQTKYLFCHRVITEEVRNELLASWDYKEPEEWNRYHEKNEVLYRILVKHSFPVGAHGFQIVRNEGINCGMIEDFYKIEFQEAAKPDFAAQSVNKMHSQNRLGITKIIQARFNSKCAESGVRIMKGEDMLYDYTAKKCYSKGSESFKSHKEGQNTADMVQANEEAYFDNFSYANNI